MFMHLLQIFTPENRIYFCPDCGERRVGAKDIVTHCRETHNLLAFPCRHCSKRFESYNSLVKHKKRLHTINKLKLKCSECSKVMRGVSASVNEVSAGLQ